MANQDFNNAIKMTRLNAMRQRLREATARIEQQKLAASLVDADGQCQCIVCKLRRAAVSDAAPDGHVMTDGANPSRH